MVELSPLNIQLIWYQVPVEAAGNGKVEACLAMLEYILSRLLVCMYLQMSSGRTKLKTFRRLVFISLLFLCRIADCLASVS